MYLIGDKIIVKDRGHKGTIEKSTEESFSVRWDSFPSSVYDYKKAECLDLWEPDPQNDCTHQIEEYVGFCESYIYCVRCGKK